MKKFLIKTQLIIAVLAGVLVLATPVMVSAQNNKDAVCKGIALTGGDCNADSGTELNKVIEGVINVVSALVGIVAVVMIMIGGFKYITSGGDSNSVNGAKNTILYALVGLVIVALAQVIVQFTLRKVDNTTPAAPAPVAPAPGP